MAMFRENSKIEINMLDGDPNGMRIAEMPRFRTLALAFRRNQLGRLRRDNSWIDERTGVYFLIGPEKNDNHSFTAYIGESENVGKRLSNHLSGNHRSNNNWADTVLVTRNDDWLTVAHGRYAESRLIRGVSNNPRWRLVNNKIPSENAGNIRASDKPEVDDFVLQAKTLVSCLGWDLFRKPHGHLDQKTLEDQEQGVFKDADAPKFIMQGQGYSAEMVIDTSGNFIVRKKSKIRIKENDSLQSIYKEIRKSLIADGILKRQDGAFVLTSDYSFSSVSAAAAVVKGTSETGRRAWKVEGEKTTYAEWEKRQGQ